MFVCAVAACKKELSQHTDPAAAVSSIVVSCDDENIVKEYSPNSHNDFSQYSFGGVAGTYFGYISSFKINNKENIEIRFGTLLSQHNVLSNEETMELIAPGTRDYGSLGVYSSYPQIKPNRAEIAFTDKKSVRWSSTRIKEKQTEYGIEAEVEITQPHGEFVVDKIKDMLISDTAKGYMVSGHFKCMVFEVNGKRSKEMKGNFSGVVSNSN
jgi:hypothetical protein